MVDWERLVTTGEYNHGGDPVTAWSIRNVIVRDTGAGIWKIDRKSSRGNVFGPGYPRGTRRLGTVGARHLFR